MLTLQGAVLNRPLRSAFSHKVRIGCLQAPRMCEQGICAGSSCDQCVSARLALLARWRARPPSCSASLFSIIFCNTDGRRVLLPAEMMLGLLRTAASTSTGGTASLALSRAAATLGLHPTASACLADVTDPCHCGGISSCSCPRCSSVAAVTPGSISDLAQRQLSGCEASSSTAGFSPIAPWCQLSGEWRNHQLLASSRGLPISAALAGATSLGANPTSTAAASRAYHPSHYHSKLRARDIRALKTVKELQDLLKAGSRQ